MEHLFADSKGIRYYVFHGECRMQREREAEHERMRLIGEKFFV
jgi:hypothetical protein